MIETAKISAFGELAASTASQADTEWSRRR
jgi:hypothetical protein